MLDLPIKRRKLKILDFDIENAPLTYWVPDRPTAQITAIASCWDGKPRTMMVHLLGRDDYRTMLEAFVERYNEADMVTGHYITRHDLPVISGALMELGMEPLSPKLVCDTKVHMIKKSDIPASQEFLSEMLGVSAPKVQMTQVGWREANRLTAAGIALTEKRVTGDVKQHMLMRQAMMEAGILHGPKVWRP